MKLNLNDMRTQTWLIAGLNSQKLKIWAIPNNSLSSAILSAMNSPSRKTCQPSSFAA